MTVQFGASVGVTLLGLLRTVSPDWVSWLFLIVAGAQLIVLALATRLAVRQGAVLTSGQPPHFSSS